MDLVGGFVELKERARTRGPVPVVLAGADTGSGLRALAAAAAEGLAEPVLVGYAGAIRTHLEAPGLESLRDARLEATAPAEGPDAVARRAVEVAGREAGAIVLKGAIRTDQLMRAALDRGRGLRTGRLLSDVLLYEDRVTGAARLVGVTDGGINPAPDREALRQIVLNGVFVFRALGFERPRVALLSATEVVSHALPSTVAARELAAWAAGHLPDADLDGPLALDNALLPAAAEAKGIGGPVAGRADLLVVPSIEAGNILGKAAKYLAGSITAHVVVGARIPILIPSRVESPEDKLHSIALGILTGAAGRD